MAEQPDGSCSDSSCGSAPSTKSAVEPAFHLTCLQKVLLVFGSFLGQFVSIGLWYSYGQLFAALKTETGESGAWLALIGSSRDFVLNASLAFMGFALHDFGHIPMLALGSAALTLGMLLDSFMPSTAGLLFSFTCVSGLGIALIYMSTMAVVFGRLKGRELPVAVGMTSCGGGLGAVAINLAQSLLIEEYGWRTCQQILALTFLTMLAVAGLALHYGMRSPKPSSQAGEATGKGEMEKPFLKSLFQPFLEPSFFLLNLGLMIYFCSFTVPYTHLSYYAREYRHYEAAATLVPTMSASGIPGRLICGFLALAFRPTTMFLWVIAAQAVLMSWLPFCASGAALQGFSASFGFISGIRTAMISLVMNELFGADRVPHLFGLVGIAVAFGVLIGPMLAGGLYDATGDYRASFWTAAGLFLLSLPVLLSAIRWTRRPKRAQGPVDIVENIDTL